MAAFWGLYFFFYLSMIFPLVPNPSPYFFLLVIASVLPQSNPPFDQTLLQKDLDHLVQWTYEWLLSFNQSKCKSLRITHSFSQSPSQPYRIGSCNIVQSSQQRDLGVIFCDDLSWSQHYNKVISKAYSILFFLQCTISPFHSVRTKCTLYISLICSCTVLLSGGLILSKTSI